MTFSTLASPGVSLQGGGGSGGGGGGTPGGSNTQIQYNSSGTFAGASGLTTNGTELTIASGTITADAPVLNMSQTWNNAAVTFTGLKFNVPTDSSASGSLLMDLQVGGTSRFKVGKGGALSFNNERTGLEPYANGLIMTANGSFPFFYDASSFRASSTASIGWTSQSTGYGTVSDTFLTRRAAANLRLGAADAAAPVAQTLSVQSVVAGTSNTAGANLTITGSQGTGTGAGGSIIFQVAPAGLSGPAQNALATALTINSAGNLILGSINTNAYIANPFGYGVELNCVNNNGYWVALNGHSGAFVGNNAPLGWSSTTSQTGVDVFLRRDAANTLALRNGANAQTFNVYNTFTDASNYERGKIAWSSNVLQIGTEKAGTGTARAVQVQTDGVTRMWFDASGHFVDVAASGVLGWTARGYLRFTDVGVLNLSTSQSNASAGFDRLQFGGTTSSFPALKRSTTFLQARLADDSAFAGFASANMQAATAYTVATLPGTPGTGMIARVTDALAPTIGATVTGGGAAYALVNYNGANWTVIGI